MLAHKKEGLLLLSRKVIKKVVLYKKKTLCMQSMQSMHQMLIPLEQAIYNLDIGNLDLSLQTFILLKQAKINTLSQLLTNISFKKTNVLLGKKVLNKNIANELKKVTIKFGKIF